LLKSTRRGGVPIQLRNDFAPPRAALAHDLPKVCGDAEDAEVVDGGVVLHAEELKGEDGVRVGGVDDEGEEGLPDLRAEGEADELDVEGEGAPRVARPGLDQFKLGGGGSGL
jgi:hypothetical protein